MKKVLLISAFLLIVAGGYYMWMRGGSALVSGDIHARIDRALTRAVIDASDFGGGMVTLKNSEGTFDIAGGSSGTVSLGTPRDIVAKGKDADVLASVTINGGGSGTFAFLVQFEYDHSTDSVKEIQSVQMGDRIEVDSITAEMTSPTSYDVLVSIKDRKPSEALSAEPMVPEVLDYSHDSDGKLVQKALIFGTTETPDFVVVAPLPDAEISNSFIAEGAARGNMYFEASFPIKLTKLDGTVLAQSPAQAKGDWMTTNLVPFKASLVAPSTFHGAAILVLKNDNPSGDPARDKLYEVPVIVR